ncbi:hypothetical protein EQO05_13535 [Methanosarcina sp. MSH10X1]|nr:hypothetical protein EQO05_13535 [Methanosarcina sp. MSH10X1]
MSGFNLTISILDPEIAEITAVSFPGWTFLPETSTVPSNSVWIKAIDLTNETVAGNTNVVLGNITITGKKAGTADLNISEGSFYDYDYSSYPYTEDTIPDAISGEINVLPAFVTPSITWSDPADIINGTALSSTQLNAAAIDPVTGNTVNGTFVYTPAAGTVLNVGTYTLHADFTPADSANYTTVSKEVTINVLGGDLLRNGLVVYYDGNLSGNSLVDLSGNSNTGFATNVTQGTNQTTGKSYINLNGVNSKIDIPNSAQTNISSPVTIEFIGSINNFKKYGAIVSKHNRYVSDWYLGSSAASPYNRARFAAATSAGWKSYESTTGLVAGQVCHIVVTYDKNIAHTYINGVDSGSSTWNSPIVGGAQNITIGSGYDLNYSNCSMYTFRLYNRSLTQDEVLKNYEYDHWRYNGNTNNSTPTITWNTPADIINGTALSITQLNAVATDPVTGDTVAGTFVYTPAAGTVLSLGTHTLHVNFTPIDTAKYTSASKDVTINVTTKVPPTITWNTPADIINGTALSSTQLNAAAIDPVTGNTVTGTFVYTPAAGTVLNVGTHTLHADFTPVDSAKYTTASKEVTITVKPTAPRTPGLVVYYDGNLSGNSLVDLSGNNNIGYATSVTQGTNPITGAKYINLNGVNSKIDVPNSAQTNISSPLTIEFIGSINNFKKYGAIVSKHNRYVSDWYLGSSAASPYNRARFAAATSAGWKSYESTTGLVAGQVYHIVVTYDKNIAHTYINGVDSGSSTWNSPIVGGAQNITIGSGYDLNYSNCSMYTFRLYNRSLSSDEVRQNYENDLWRHNGYTNTKATPTITWSNPAAITYGTALSSTQLNAKASVPGSFIYNPASGTIPRAGTHTLQTTFTPTDSAHYNTATRSVSLTVDKATPVITWNPAAITSGVALSVTQLNAVATDPVTGDTVAGTFAYTPAAGTVLSVGTHTLHVDFTPADTANYKSVSKDVTLIATSHSITPSITWSKPADITYGTALSSIQLNALASVPGSFVYTPASGAILGAGVHALQATFTPSDLTNYTTASGGVSLTVNKALPLITWSNPADISSGTPLGEAQLNAVASVPGSFVYTPEAGMVLSEGTHTLQVAFTPADVTNYTTASSSVSINVVSKAPSKSSSGTKKDNPVKLKILEPNSTQSSSSTGNIGKEIKSESGNKTINEGNEEKIDSELGNEVINQHNMSNKGKQTEQKEIQSIPGFGIACSMVCLFGALLCKRK